MGRLPAKRRTGHEATGAGAAPGGPDGRRGNFAGVGFAARDDHRGPNPAIRCAIAKPIPRERSGDDGDLPG